MAEFISKINYSKNSTAKPPGKPPTREKLIGIDPAIRFNSLKYGDKTE